jgi:serine/threonine protein kinase
MTLTPGIRLGPYEILSPLSVAGLGEVYRGRHPGQGRDVVIRVLRLGQDAGQTLLPRLAADVLEAGVLTHLTVPKVYDVGTTTDTLYIVSKPFDGETFRALFDRGEAACTSYGGLLETWGSRPGAPSEMAEARTYIDTVCMSAEVPDAGAPG